MFNNIMNTIQTFWPVKIRGDVTVCVQPNIQQMSSYVLLEQEDWFEDEMEFVRAYIQPEMNALDIGANHGVYALSIARKLTTGQVWAFEPTMAPGEMLARSIELNGFSDRITLVRAGLSDHGGSAEITTSINSELNSLYGTNGQKETIRLETLDEFLANSTINAVFDFVKLDAEGEEINVLKGGHAFFRQQSPLIMFELKHGNQVNHGLIEAIQTLGYTIYRLLPEINILVEYEHSFQDGYLLNLFACKPDRAAQLARRGLLVSADEMKDAAAKGGTIHPDWAERMKNFPYATMCQPVWSQKLSGIPESYLGALSACLQLYDEYRPAVQRVLLLYYASGVVEQLTQAPQGTSLPVWLLKIHLFHLLGQRAVAVSIATQVAGAIKDEKAPDWPFLPPAKSFFLRQPKGNPGSWLLSCLLEFKEYRQTFSSYFMADALSGISPLLGNPNHAIAMDRRAILAAKRAGRSIEIPAGHPVFDPALSMNAGIWCRICMGGTISEQLLFDESPVHIVDVGASSHGKMTEPYAPLMMLDLARITGFQPNEAECIKLNQLYAESGKYRYFPKFVGRGGPATFYETNWFMTGSLYKPNREMLDAFEQLDSVVNLQAIHPVITTSIADIEDIDDIDLIKIDVQGAELDVFQGTGKKLNDVLVIWTEVEFVPLYENQPLFSEIEQFLRGHGFMFHSFSGIASRCFKPYAQQSAKRGGTHQAIWSDAIFIRDFRTLDELSNTKLKKLAAILDLVIRSTDLCYRVLKLIDQREGSNYAAAYLQER